MNRPLWQRARKNFIKLVDDDKIPETHKRLNHHYLRRRPYYAISTEPPIIVEAPAPSPDVILLPVGYVHVYGDPNGLCMERRLLRPLYRSEAKELFGDLSDNELLSRFFEEYMWKNWL